MRGQHCIGRKDRHEVDVDTVILREDGSRSPVKVTNASEDGCRLETELMFRIGERVSIALPRMGDIQAKIRWALPGAAGTQFVHDVAYDVPQPFPSAL